MADITFSKHAILKIDILKNHGFKVSKELIESVITFPDKIEKGYKDRLIAQKKIDDEHVIRVVHEKEREKILVITLYPARRSRYEKD